VILPPLVARLGSEAQNIRLDLIPWSGPATLTPELERSLHIVLACTPDAFPGFHRQRLYEDADVLAVARGHKLGNRLRQLPAFLEARHVAVIGQGRREDMIDEWLRKEGVERRIALSVPSYLQALRIAARSDLVAFVPSRLIASFDEGHSLLMVRPPLDPGIDLQFLFYPTRAQVDPASIWLRSVILELGRGLDQKRGRAA
jgi:DNA-binding transcriptional LysR family regulator